MDDACIDRGEELAGFCAVQILRNTAAPQTVSNVIFVFISASGRRDSTAKYRELRESRYAKFPRANEFAQSGDGALEEKRGNVILLANGEERAERVRRVLNDYQIDVPEIVDGNLQTGFELPSIHLVVITEGEIFTQKQRKARKVEKKLENAERIKSYQELKVGDYVVHVNHGIGKYVGIGTLEVGGIHKDYLHIMYAGGDKLSVPIDQIDLIQKYVGSEEKEPKVYKLGGSRLGKSEEQGTGIR